VVPEERGSIAKGHTTREKVSFVTGWEVERVGSRAQMILNGRSVHKFLRTWLGFLIKKNDDYVRGLIVLPRFFPGDSGI